MALENGFSKGGDKVESTSEIAKARDKIDSIGEQVEEQYQNWKRVLSGALNDKQLIVALGILFVFYLFFTGFNTILGGNSRKENTVTCVCPAGQSEYYRALLIITIVVWVVCFALTIIWDLVKFWRYEFSTSNDHEHQHRKNSSSRTHMENGEGHTSSVLKSTSGSVGAGTQTARNNTPDMVDGDKKTFDKAEKNPSESLSHTSINMIGNVVENQSNVEGPMSAMDTAGQNSGSVPTIASSDKLTEVSSNIAREPISAATELPVDNSQTAGMKPMLSGAAKSEKSKIKQLSHPKKPVPYKLTPADGKALTRLEHYENYLWLQFYKAYSVGATLEEKHEDLPEFVKVIVDDQEEFNENEGDVDDELKPLIASKKLKKHEKTELAESSYDEVDGNHLTGEDHNTVAEVINVDIESDIFPSGEISNSYKNDAADNYEISNSSTVKNDDSATVHHETNSLTTNQDNMESTPVIAKLSETTDHPLAAANLIQSNASLPTVKSDSAGEDEADFAAKPMGLYIDQPDNPNVCTCVTDETCSRIAFFLHPLLIITRLLSQLVLVPLLLFQILDTYTWICITDEVYCSSVFNQYRLGLDKAALTFTFYCCLLAAILSTAILRWFPYSKMAHKAEATCLA